MNRTALTLASIALTAVMASHLPAAEPVKGRLIPPPAIYIPQGGTVVTEINLRDEDVLGMIKEIIPAAAEVARGIFREMVESGSGPGVGKALAPMAMAGQIDIDGFMQAIEGITGVRVLVVKYPKPMDPQVVLKQLDSGVAKAGVFSKVLSDVAMFPGAVAIYAAPDNGGFMGFAYHPEGGKLYAARIVGFVDVAEMTRWAGSLAKMFLGERAARVEEAQEAEETAPAEPIMPPPVEEMPAEIQ